MADDMQRAVGGPCAGARPLARSRRVVWSNVGSVLAARIAMDGSRSPLEKSAETPAQAVHAGFSVPDSISQAGSRTISGLAADRRER